jgi:putative peptidoglycan lipid II flippase
MSILRSGISVAFFTLLSRISGLLRELFMAYIFGSSAQADCINVALKIPNLFRRIFGEGALTSVFVPMYSHKLQQGSSFARDFASQVWTMLLCILICTVVVMQIFMPQMMMILAPGFYSGEKLNLAIMLSRITMPYLIFISLCALMGGMLNSINQFRAFAAVPILLNVAIIIACVILLAKNNTPLVNTAIIAWSIIASGILQILFMYYFLRKYKLHFAFTAKFLSSDSKKLLKQMLPATFSAGMAQISLFVSQSLASFIDGAISIIGYAERIYQFPLSLIGTAFGTVLLPKLSKFYAAKDLQGAKYIQEKSFKFALIISVPASVGLCILADWIVSIIYQRGAFSSADTLKTSACLLCFSLGLPAFILNKILGPIFYANNDQQSPFKISLYSLVFDVLMSFILMRLLGFYGIALASSLSAWFNCYLLLRICKRKMYFDISAIDIWRFMARLSVASAIMGIILFLAKKYLCQVCQQLDSAIKLFLLIAMIFVSFVIYVVSSLLCKTITKQDITNIFKQ